MDELKILSYSEYTDVMIAIHKALSRIDPTTRQDHATQLYLFQDLIGAIDCAYEEFPE